MSGTNPARRVLAALAVITVALTVTAAVLTSVEASSAAPLPAPGPASRQAHRTTVTILAPHCNGCEIGMNSGVWDDTAPDGVRYWYGPSGTVHRGKLTFRVDSEHLQGMSLAMTTPWEGQTGYTTTVAMRYAGHRTGERISLKEARAARRATACYAGTSARAVTFRLVTRRVPVAGVHGRTPGTLAYASTTQEWLKPLRRTYHGVMGSQDLDVCGSKTG